MRLRDSKSLPPCLSSLPYYCLTAPNTKAYQSLQWKKSLSRRSRKFHLTFIKHIILTGSRDQMIIRSLYIHSCCPTLANLTHSVQKYAASRASGVRRCCFTSVAIFPGSSILLPSAPLNPSICQNQILLNTFKPLALCPDWKLLPLPYQGVAFGNAVPNPL